MKQPDKFPSSSTKAVSALTGQLSNFVESLPSAVIFFDPGGHVTHANTKAEKLFGINRETMRGIRYDQTDWQVSMPDGRSIEPSELPFSALLEGQAVHDFEVVADGPDGRHLALSVDATATRDESGRITGVAAFFTDPSKFREEAEFGARLASIVEAAEDSLIAYTPDGIITAWNRGSEKLYGYASGEIMGRSMSALIPLDRADEFQYILARIQRKEPIRRLETVRLRKDGSLAQVSLSASPIVNTQGEVTGVSVIARDVSREQEANQALQQWAHMSETLGEIIGDVAITLDAGEIAYRAIRKATEAIGAEKGVFYTRDRDHWVVTASAGFPPEIVGTRYTDTEAPFAATAARTNDCVVTQDAHYDERTVCRLIVEYKIQSMLVAPLLLRGKATGVLIFSYMSSKVAFSDMQIDFARKLGSYLAVSLENAKLFTEQRTVSSQLSASSKLSEALNNINLAIARTRDPDEMVNQALELATKAIDADRAITMFLEEDKWVIKHGSGAKPTLVGTELAFQEARAGIELINTREPLVSENAENDPRLNADLIESLAIRSIIILPLSTKEEIGMVAFHWTKRHAILSDAHVAFGTQLATAVSTALDNAALTRHTEEELARTQLLEEVATAATASPDLNTAADLILSSLREHLSLEAGDIRVLDEENQTLVLLSSVGHAHDDVELIKEVPLGASGFLTTEAVRKKMLLTHEDDPLTPERERVLERAGLSESRYATVPVVSRGRIMGTLSLVFNGRRDFTPIEAELFRTIASTVAQAFENASLFEMQRNIAHTFQEALLKLPDRIPGVEFGQLYRSATETARVGGDFFDLFDLENGNVGILIGDVAGKGLDAATLTGVLKTTFRAYVHEGYEVSEVVSRTNDLMTSIGMSQPFVTLFFAVLNVRTGSMKFVNAGHPHPVIYRQAAQKAELLRSSCPPIGIFKDQKYVLREVTLETNDRLVLYTDGLSEARRGSELFGDERVLSAVEKIQGSSTKLIPQVLFQSAAAYASHTLSDDVAILAISRSDDGSAGGPAD